jgi:hypothetical protein
MGGYIIRTWSGLPTTQSCSKRSQLQYNSKTVYLAVSLSMTTHLSDVVDVDLLQHYIAHAFGQP